MTRIVVMGSVDSVAYIVKSLQKQADVACNLAVVDGWLGRNFLRDYQRKFAAMLKTRGGIRCETTRGLNNGRVSLQGYDLLLISSNDLQGLTDFGLFALRLAYKKEKIFVVPPELRTEGAPIWENGQISSRCVPLDKVLPSLRYIEYHVTDFCNLKCKGCGHCANIVERMEFASVEDLTFSLERMSEKFANITTVRLMGGEPLLCDRLYEYIDAVHQRFPLANVKVVSNGLLYKRINDQTAEAMRNANAELQISNYPPTVEINEQIREFCAKKGIKVSIGGTVMQFFRKEHSSLDVGYETCWRNCESKTCHFLRGKRLYYCVSVWVKQHFSQHVGKYAFSMEEAESASFDLSTEINEDGWDMLLKMESPFPLCQKCGDKKVFFQWESEALNKR